MVDLLPPNASPLERNLARTGAMIERVPVPLRDLANPATCPVSALPFLAASFSVDHWEASWPVETKRAMIQSAFAVHKHKGTITAIRRALHPISAGIRVREWWETTPPGARGTFHLDVEVLDSGATTEMYQQIERLVDEAKPVSRHMAGLAIHVGVRGSLHIGASIHLGDEMTIYARVQPEVQANGGTQAGGMVHVGDNLTVYARAAPDIRAAVQTSVGAMSHFVDTTTIHPIQS